jgi:hypothetical protein
MAIRMSSRETSVRDRAGATGAVPDHDGGADAPPQVSPLGSHAVGPTFLAALDPFCWLIAIGSGNG